MAGNNRDITLTVEVKEKGDGAKKAAKDLEEVDKAAVGAADAMKGASTEASKFEKSIDSVGENVEDLDQSMVKATRTVRTHQEQVAHLRAEYERVSKQLKDLDVQLGGTNVTDKAGLKKARAEQRSLLADIKAAAKAADIDLIERVPKPNLGGGMGRIGGMPAPVIGGLLAAATAAAPALGSILGGAIVGATGTAAMAAGIASAAQDSRVQAAAKRFGEDISANFFAGGEAFVEPVIDGLAILKDAFHDLNLDETLGKAAPTVKVIAEGIADFAKNLKPGLDETLERIGPFAEVAADGIGEMGDALGDMIDMISESEGSLDGLRAMFALVNGALRFTGAQIQFLEDRFHEITNLIGIFSGAARNTGFRTLDDGIRQVTGRSAEFSGQITFMGTASGQAAQKAYELAHGLAEVETEAFSAIDALKQYDDQLAGRVNNQIAFEESLDDLAAGFKEFSRNLNIDTQNGRENMKNFEDAITDAQKARDDLVAQGKIEEANAAYQRMVQRIREVMAAAGFTKAQIDAMVAPRELVIGITYKQNNRPPVYVAGNLSQGALDAAGAGRRASGGPVMAGQPYIVGEKRAELFVPQQNGYILPSVPRGVGGAMWVAPINYTPSGRQDWDRWFEDFRTQVQRRGGTLAVVGVRG